MKLTLLCFGFLHLSIVTEGLFSRSELTDSSSLTSSSDSRAQLSPNTGSPNPSRKRPLFARRGQYERQRVQASKPKKLPLKDAPPPPDAAPKPVSLKCSQLRQSCVPQSGCCDAGATCRCRFFNTICFCRRTASLQKKKT
ncbi:agouti-signaling protein-like [Cheilinus undulatus]|uniref:agouti-signaling protein-like n=1 Tax=Cheilinus undulatus TaxID=241271 RepID=UPI001BD5B1D5|nr:agouti-signaling protein-like [Cheilinus undulatus]